MGLSPSTPVIIGVGQSSDRIDSSNFRAWSASDLAAAAANEALADSQVGKGLLSAIDAIAATKTFEDSRPFPAPFGKSANLPRSIAQRLGISPRYALWARGGGTSPQDLVNEFSERIAAGEFEVVLIAGAEAISTVRHALSQGQKLDFAEDPGGQIEDRGAGFGDFADSTIQHYRMASAPLVYALAENARRARLHMSKDAYAAEMGRLFAPFSTVAHRNSRSASDVPAYTSKDLVTTGPRNKWIADPYPLRLVARDQVNLGAAILMASLQAATALGVPRDQLVFLHGYARAEEKPLVRRPDLGASPAARRSSRLALQLANVQLDDFVAFDFYSCFPIAVSNVAIDEFGMSPEDPRGLTVTGGLPFFGGPGNNYSMHAIAEMVRRMRLMDGCPGFVGANGGYLSKYSVGIYSCDPRPWRACSSQSLKAELDAVPPPDFASLFGGVGRIETYTVAHENGQPARAFVIGRSPSGARFIARSSEGDAETVHEAHQNDVLERMVTVKIAEQTNFFRFA